MYFKNFSRISYQKTETAIIIVITQAAFEFNYAIRYNMLNYWQYFSFEN